KRAIKTPMIAMTTKSSISVNPRGFLSCPLVLRTGPPSSSWSQMAGSCHFNKADDTGAVSGLQARSVLGVNVYRAVLTASIREPSLTFFLHDFDHPVAQSDEVVDQEAGAAGEAAAPNALAADVGLDERLAERVLGLFDSVPDVPVAATEF